MKLKIKDLSFLTGGPFIAIINKEDARNLDLNPRDRIHIVRGNKKVSSSIDIAENGGIVRSGQIGLYDEVLDKLGTHKGNVSVSLAKRLKSLAFIKKKLEGKKLNKNELNEIIKDVVNNDLNAIELTYFISACYTRGLSNRETIDLTKVIVNNGSQLKVNKYPILDKHCSGGVPGNRTTMVVVPILAAAGLTIPKTSSRSISSPAGTADTMEFLTEVTISVDKIKKIVAKTNACIVWGGGVNLAAADDKLIKLRHPMSLDPEGLLLASIMAKKAAVNATHVLIDLPAGNGSKFETKKQAMKLKKKFLSLGKLLKMKIKVILTDGRQPIGNGIGPALEARDVLWLLKNDKRSPKDLRDKSLKIAGIMMNMAGIKNGFKKSRDILDSGKAYEKMKEIIKEQGGDYNINPDKIILGKYRSKVRAKKTGIVRDVNSQVIAKIARIAGSPLDKKAGIYLEVHEHNIVKKGQVLFTLYSENRKRFNYAKEFLRNNHPILVS
ncbi:AMP phosphorylase [archaeon]|nr:AMP phosphorylase [archaeon]